jgi:hypothetical protein
MKNFVIVIYIYIYVGFLFYFIDLKVFVKTGRKMVVGSALGGMKETQEMIEFAAKHNITADIEVISMEYVNTAMERLAKGDVRYRFLFVVFNTLAANNHLIQKKKKKKKKSFLYLCTFNSNNL